MRFARLILLLQVAACGPQPQPARPAKNPAPSDDEGPPLRTRRGVDDTDPLPPDTVWRFTEPRPDTPAPAQIRVTKGVSSTGRILECDRATCLVRGP